MQHLNLADVPEPVRDFVMSVVGHPAGSVLELDGYPIAWLVPAEPGTTGEETPWTEAKNQRRCDLIDRKFASGLGPAETVELAKLQEEMLRYRQKVAPLPLEEARKLHQELLTLASDRSGKG